jgi:hypothetical protein
VVARQPWIVAWYVHYIRDWNWDSERVAFALAIIVVFAFAAVIVIVVLVLVNSVQAANLRFVQLLVFDEPPFEGGHLFLHTTRTRLRHAVIGSVGLHEPRKRILLRAQHVKVEQRGRLTPALAAGAIALADHGRPHDGAERVHDAGETLDGVGVLVLVVVT